MQSKNNIVIRFMYYQPVEKYVGKKRDYTKERNFVSCNADFDYVKYVTSGLTTPTDYEIYIGNNEKCSGLFNESGYLDKKQIAELRKNLRSTKSNIWDMVVSFREDFGNKYCKDYDQAYSFLKSELPKFFKRIGLDKNNIVWYAGLHENTENKHLHVSFFEKEPKHFQNDGKLTYSKGSISKEQLMATKLSFENKLTNATGELFAKRKEITQKLKTNLSEKELNEYTKRELIKLYNKFPTTGKLGYDSENMYPSRKYIIEFINNYIPKNKDLFEKFSQFESEYNNYVDYAKSIDKSQMFSSFKMDLYRRMGNIVISSAVAVGKTHNTIENQIKYGRKTKIYKKNLREKEFDYCLKLANQFDRERERWYEEFKARVDYMIKQEQWQNTQSEYYLRNRNNDYEM